MQRRLFNLLPLAALAPSLLVLGTMQPALAQGIELEGVKYPPSVTLAGRTLQLNGAGVRYRVVVKVYTAGLYVENKAGTTEATLGQPGPKRLHVVMLRAIDANDLGRLFTRGMKENTSREEFAKCIPGTIQLAELFAARKRLAAGDSFSVDYVPGKGTAVLVNGQTQGEPIQEPAFFNALMRIWLGDKPADGPLKEALLGRAAAAPVTGQN